MENIKMKNIMDRIENKLMNLNPKNKYVFDNTCIDKFLMSNGFELIYHDSDCLVDLPPFYRKKYDNEYVGTIYMDCTQYIPGYLNIEIYLDDHKDHTTYACDISNNNFNVMNFGIEQIIYAGIESAVDEFIANVCSKKEEEL